MSPTRRSRSLIAPCVLLGAALVTLPARGHAQVLDNERPSDSSEGSRPRSIRVVPNVPDDDDAAPSDRRDSEAAPGQEHVAPYHPAHNAMWVEPIWPLLGLFFGSYATNVGFSHSLGRGLDLVVQGSLGAATQYSTAYPVGGLSIGLTVFLTGTEPMNGLFVSPNVFFNVGSNVFRSTPTDYLGGGVDIGYQYAVGGFFVAPVLGVGWQAAFPQGGSAPSTPTYATRLNLAGIRIGWTFDGARGSPGERERAQRLLSHGDHGVDFARDHRPRTVAIWTWPAWMAIGPLFNRYNVGLGVTVRMNERIRVVAEGTYEWGAMNNGVTGTRSNFSRVDAALGAEIVLWSPDAGLSGLFLHPKLYGNYFIPGAAGVLAPAFGAGFGLDIGYAFQVGPLYVAPVFGLRLGATAVASPGALTRQQPTGFTPEVNFTLLRMGVAF